MDANKVAKMKEVGYSIRPTCSICVHSIFRPGTSWGVCDRFKYVHGKHSDATRFMSIYRSGICKDFSLDPLAEMDVGDYMKEFYHA